MPGPCNPCLVRAGEMGNKVGLARLRVRVLYLSWEKPRYLASKGSHFGFFEALGFEMAENGPIPNTDPLVTLSVKWLWSRSVWASKVGVLISENLRLCTLEKLERFDSDTN